MNKSQEKRTVSKLIEVPVTIPPSTHDPDGIEDRGTAMVTDFAIDTRRLKESGIKENINEAVKKFIKSLHIPQSKIASELGVTPQTVNRWVKGDAQKMLNSNLRALAELGGSDIVFSDDMQFIKFYKRKPETGEAGFDQGVREDTKMQKEALDKIETLSGENAVLKKEIEELKKNSHPGHRLNSDFAINDIDLTTQFQQTLFVSNIGQITEDIFNLSPYPMTLSVNETFFAVNKAFTDMFGWTKGDVVGKNFYTSGLLTNGDAEKVMDNIREGKKSDSYFVKLTRKKGGKIPVRVDVIRGKNGKGETVSLAMGVVSDEEFREWSGYHAFEDLNNENIADEYQAIEIFNPDMLEKDFGYKKVEDFNIFKLIHPDEIPRAIETRKKILKYVTDPDNGIRNYTSTNQYRVRHADGEYLKTNFIIKVIYNPKQEKNEVRAKIYFKPAIIEK